MNTVSRAVGIAKRNGRAVIPVLGVTQIFAWGSSYYLVAVLAKPIVLDTGWSLSWVIGGLSVGLVTAGLISPRVGRTIHRIGGRPVLAASAALLSIGLLGLGLAHSLSMYFRGLVRSRPWHGSWAL